MLVWGPLLEGYFQLRLRGWGRGGEVVLRLRLKLNQVKLETWSNIFHAIITAISTSFCFILVPSLFFLPSHLCPCFPYLHRSIFKVSQFLCPYFFLSLSLSPSPVSSLMFTIPLQQSPSCYSPISFWSTFRFTVCVYVCVYVKTGVTSLKHHPI